MALLAGINVVSLAVNLPGPAAARRLCQLGARGCKVEPPTGDPRPSTMRTGIGSSMLNRKLSPSI